MNLAFNWDNVDNFGDGLGYFAVGAAAGAASAAIGGAGGLTAIQAATIGGSASGAIIGGGNIAMQGGSGADIFAGAVGGSVIGAGIGLLGGAAIKMASNIPANWYGDAHSDGWLNLANQPINLGDVFNDLAYKVSNIGGIGGGGALNLFHFTSGSVTPPKVNLQSNTIDGFVNWFSYLEQNRAANLSQGSYYHVDDIVDHRTILRSHLKSGMYGESLIGVENSVRWNISDPHYRKKSNWNDNYVDSPIADQPDPNVDYFRIRLRLNRKTKISLTTNSYDLYIKMHDRIYGSRVY